MALVFSDEGGDFFRAELSYRNFSRLLRDVPTFSRKNVAELASFPSNEINSGRSSARLPCKRIGVFFGMQIRHPRTGFITEIVRFDSFEGTDEASVRFYAIVNIATRR